MPPRRRAQRELSPGEMLLQLSEKLSQQSREPNILAYKPHAKQELFHKSPAKRRLYIGGNRSGKTVGGITEDIFYMRGSSPYKRVPEAPTRGRIVSTDFSYGVQQVIIPKLKQWLPPSMLVNGSWEDSYSSEFKLLTLSNGSTVELMTYEQDPDKFAGTSRHWIHYDEEPPRPIYNECQARLIDTYGDAWLTMTPLEGMTWVYDDLYLAGTENKDPGVFVVEIDIHENPYLNPEAVEEYLKTVDPDERKAREKGHFITLGGKVFKNFSVAEHVIPPLTPQQIKAYWKYPWFRSMDHGFNNPTAWLWHVALPDGTIITFSEHYARELTVTQHAEIVLARDAELGKVPDITLGDPATQQRQGVTGTSIAAEYALKGIYIAPGNNDVQIGVGKMQEYLKINPKTNKPYWLITENCDNLIREMQRLRWRTYSSKKAIGEHNAQEEIHKKDDHACDSARYFFSSQPNLAPAEEVVKPDALKSNGLKRYDEALAEMFNGNYQPEASATKWKVGASALEWDG